MYNIKKKNINLKNRIFRITLLILFVPFVLYLISIFFASYRILINKENIEADNYISCVTDYIDSKKEFFEKGEFSLFRDQLASIKSTGWLLLLDEKGELLFSTFKKEGLDIKNLLSLTDVRTFLFSVDKKKGMLPLVYEDKSYRLFLRKINSETGVLSVLYILTEDRVKIEILKFTIPSIIIFIIVVFVVVILINKFGERFVKSLTNLNYAVNRMTDGKLNIEILSTSTDEIGDIYKNLNRLITAYATKLSQVKRFVSDIASYNKKLASVINEIEASVKSQLLNVKTNLKKIEDLNNSIMRISFSVSEAQGIVEQAYKSSNESTALINDMIDEINKIAEISDEFNDAIELIESISEKTRLLSVNSAVEASRAGDAGKGFNVVAGEIKKVAMESKDVATKISELVRLNSKIVKDGVEKSSAVFDVLNSVKSSIKMVTDIMGQISQESSEKGNEYNNLKNINNNVLKMGNEILKNSFLLEKLNSVLTVESNRVIELIDKFVVASGEKELIKDYNGKSNEKKDEVEPLDKDILNRLMSSNKVDIVRSVKLYKQKEGSKKNKS